MDKEYLAHYGVKGMRWGIRKLSRRVKDKLRRSYSNARDSFSRYRQGRKQRKVIAKKAGYKIHNSKSMEDFDRIRKRTLASHDPKVIAKGMHTLSDSELQSKLDRLKLESQISNIVVEREKASASARKAKAEATANTILGKAATNVLTNVGSNAGKSLVNIALNKLTSGTNQSDDTKEDDTTNKVNDVDEKPKKDPKAKK